MSNSSDRLVSGNLPTLASGSVVIRPQAIIRTNGIIPKDLTKSVQAPKTCAVNGLPDLLPVAPRPPPAPVVSTALAPAGYILVPASAVGTIQSIRTASLTNLQLIPAGTLQQATSTGTIVVVGAPSTKPLQISSTCVRSAMESTSAAEAVGKQNPRPSDGDASSHGGCIVDNASLRQSMGRNRESLKRKLLQRRSIRELIDQGILPPPKTPPSYYEQRIKLERAKMSDILKHKIEHRPDKQQLVSQHILLDSCADPGILEKQQQLKKCKLADSLNEKLANRPGPLELVQENILHVDAALEQAIKDGRLQFKPTSAGLIQKHPQPVFVVTHDASSLNSATEHGAFDCTGLSFDPTAALNHSSFSQPSMDMTTTMLSTASASDQQTGAGGFASATPVAKTKPKKTKAKVRVAGSGSGMISKNGANAQSTKPPHLSGSSSKLIRFSDTRKASAVENRTNNSCKLGGNSKLPTAGMVTANGQVADKPSFSQSGSPFDDAGGHAQSQETSYDLLLQQQQLLLQWQYELQQKYPNSTVQLVSLSSSKSAEQQQQLSMNFSAPAADNAAIISSVQSSPGAFGGGGSSACGGGSLPQTPAPLARSDSDGCATASGSATVKPVKRLEDMKVNDLKMECKRRNLPVSGSKSNIVERLKPFEDVILAAMQQIAAGQQQHAESAGAGGTFPASPLCHGSASANGQQRGALPPISFLCANSGSQNVFASSTASSPNNNGTVNYSQHNEHGSMVQGLSSGADVINSYVNRSSSSSDFPSNYSSPGIDLSVLNFGNGMAGGCSEEIPTNGESAATTTTTEQYTFSTPDFGAQFLVTSSANGPRGNGAHGNGVMQSGYDERPVTAMDMGESGQRVGFQQTHISANDAPTPIMGSMATPPLSTSSQHYQQHQQRLPFLQAANTLTVHEEVLRQQQKKIEEIQKELQRSQELLRQQQQMIVAAKQMQSEANESGMSDADCILSQLDTKQIQKAHIQLFLQQKIQQQQLQQQINVQQELMEIQQKLQEEMTVHQALNEVVRLLRQEPRVSILVLHLLRRHQLEQQQSTPTQGSASQSQQKQQSSQHSDSHGDQGAETRRMESNALGTSKRSDQKQLQQSCSQQQQSCARKLSSSPASSLSSASSYQASHTTDQSAASTENPGQATAPKNRQGSGHHAKKAASILQSPLARASSVPTSPMKSKSNSSMGDMEEIFRNVLDYASKATEKTGGCLESFEQQQNPGALPSFDQLLQPSRSVSEIETAITISNGSGILMTSARQQHQQQLSVLDHLSTTAADVRRFSNAEDMLSKGATADPLAVNETTPSATAFMYTRNEAFDDLMEVLRNNEAPLLDNGNEEHANSVNSCPSSLTSANGDNEAVASRRGDPNVAKQRLGNAAVSQAHQQLNLLSAFGAQEVADLLGTEWFNVESLLPQQTGAGMSNGNDTLNMAQSPDLNAFGVSVLSSGRVAESKPSDSRNDDRNTGASGAVVLVSSDMSDQMDWLDLILPSPSSAGAGGALHELPVMNCLPMDTDAAGGDSTACRSDSLLNGNTCDNFGVGHPSMMSSSTHNPVLAMSACVSGEGL